MDGYMIDVQCDADTLRVHAKTKAARGALTGWDANLATDDEGKWRVSVDAGADTVVIPRSAIASVSFKGASMMVNGNLVVTTTDGARYQLHFRKKQHADFAGLAQELGAAV